MGILNKSRIYFVILLLVLIALSVTLLKYFASEGRNDSIPDLSISHATYNAEEKNFLEQDIASGVYKAKINFSFTVNSYHNHDNIFEILSSKGDPVMRMEFSSNNVVGIALGQDKEIVGTIVKTDIKPGKKYDVFIKYYKGKIDLTIDGKKIKINQFKKKLDLGKITIGYGFNKDRYFNGSIENFEAKFFVRKISFIDIVTIIIATTLIVTIVVLVKNIQFSKILPRLSRLTQKALITMLCTRMKMKYFIPPIVILLASIIVAFVFFDKQENQKKLPCNARIATIGHLYSIIGRVEVIQEKRILKTFPKIAESLALQLNKLNLDAIILTGDITVSSTKEEWAIIDNLIKNVNAKIYATPGNHDTANKKIMKDYLNNFDYTSKVIDVGGCNVVMINSTNGDIKKYDSTSAVVGNPLSKENIKTIISVDKNKINLLMMHHAMTTRKFNKNKIFSGVFLKHKKDWDKKIVPLLRGNNIKHVYTGDHFSEALSFVEKNDIYYVNTSVTMDKSGVKSPMFILIDVKNDVIRNEVQYIDLPRDAFL